jgi:lysylphosphatidylglycerol synthetase-like protein (DUF2156 family)
MSGNIKIPPDLMREVESEISPNYLKQQKESKLKTYLTILTTTVAILSTILDSSLERVVNIIFFILIIPILFQWLRLSRPWRENKVLIYLFQEPHRILLSSAVFLLLLSFLSIFLYENMDYSYKSYDFFAEIGLILLFFSLLLFIISGAVYFNYWLRNRKSPHNEKKKKDDPVKSEKASK